MIQEQNCPTLGSAPFLLFKYSGLCKPVTPAGLMASWVSRGNCWPLWQPAPRSGCRVWSFTRFEHLGSSLSGRFLRRSPSCGDVPGLFYAICGFRRLVSSNLCCSRSWADPNHLLCGSGGLNKIFEACVLVKFPLLFMAEFYASVKPLKLDTNFL